jgi:hypothetical protein
MNEPSRYLGIHPPDLEGKPYAKFWNPTLAPLSAHAREALAQGPVAGPLLPALAEAAQLLDPTCETLENGYCLCDDGSLRIAIRTEMPGGSPAMVDWWFGWHSDEPQRYKLWQPRAHVHAEWGIPPAASAQGRDRYVGCVSHVDEYLGSELGRYAIRFLPPQELGLDEQVLADPEQATAICARVGFASYPLDFAYLIHHVRRTPSGAEMRSRFWIGGPHSASRHGGLMAKSVVNLTRFLKKPKSSDGQNLLVHCAQEMAHLVSFLPQLYAELK